MLETETYYLIVIVHLEHMIPVKKTAHHVEIHASVVPKMENVLIVLKDMDQFQTAHYSHQLLNPFKFLIYQSDLPRSSLVRTNVQLVLDHPEHVLNVILTDLMHQVVSVMMDTLNK